MGKRRGATFLLRKTTREEFIGCIDSDSLNRFAKTFRAKADMQELWPCLGCWQVQELGESIVSRLAGAIAWTISSRQPYVANLQLLHTFAWARRMGVATMLCNEFLEKVKDRAEYFRVSSEPGAVEFYKSLGIQFHGMQKSGSYLGMAKLNGAKNFKGLDYDPNLPLIKAAIHRKGKGGCVTVFQVKE